jgi:glycosyltransferase involved in cell wall biosynthesis
MGHEVAVTFVYKPERADDHGAGAEYFFEYGSKPNKFKKVLFLIRYVFKNPALYFSLLKSHYSIYPKIYRELVLYSAYGVWIDEVIATYKPDIILSQAALIKTYMAAMSAKRRNIPIVYEPYAEIHDQKMGVNKHMTADEQKKYWTAFLEMSALVIGMDNCSVGALMYLPPERVKAFYDCCDYNAYQMKLDKDKMGLRDDLKLPHDLFLVGMVGAFHYRKGHDHLIKAIAMLNKQGHKVGAAICGGTRNPEEDLAKWRALAKEEGVEDKIFFSWNFSEHELVRLHRSLDGYCNLSNSTRSCGLDLSLLEAMSSGLPIVVYDTGALKGAVPEGKNGFVVHNGNIEGVAESILKLYQMDLDQRKEMGEASRAFAERLDVNNTAKLKMEWFEDIVAKNQK